MSDAETGRGVTPVGWLARRWAELESTGERFDLSTRDGRRESFRELRARFLRLQPVLNPAVCFEIGAAEATFSRHLVLTSWRGRRIAFEGNPYAYAKYMADKPGRDVGLEYLNLAITSEPGPLTFYVQKRKRGADRDPTLGDNSIMRRAVREAGDFEEATVEGISLDNFMAGAGLSDASFSAWIDVEGASRPVLEGMAGVMGQALSIMIEVEEREIWAGQWLADDVCGFMHAHGLIPCARDFDYPGQYNIVFVRVELADRPDVVQTLTGPPPEPL